jgi:hypothetical protein
LQATNAVRSAGPNAFSNVLAVPVLAAGKYTITNSATPAKQFFRLAK